MPDSFDRDATKKALEWWENSLSLPGRGRRTKGNRTTSLCTARGWTRRRRRSSGRTRNAGSLPRKERLGVTPDGPPQRTRPGRWLPRRTRSAPVRAFSLPKGAMTMQGRLKENGVWRAGRSHYRLMWRNHDSLYIALGRWRLRLMKPRWMR